MSSSVIPATTPVSWTAVPNGSAATPSFAFQNSSSTGIYRVAADSLGISTAGVQRVVVDASGNVGIGTASPTEVFHLGGATNKQIRIDTADSVPMYIGGYQQTLNLAVNRRTVDGTIINTGRSSAFISINGSSGGSNIQFATAAANNTQPAERMQIDSSGQLLIGRSESAVPGTTNGFVFTQTANIPALFNCFNTSGLGNTYHLYNHNATNNGYRFYVQVNGGIANYSANNTNLSDERVKTDINLASNYLEKICSIPVKTFRYKDQGDDMELTLGVIAQDVEKIAPELVNTTDGFGDLPEDGVPLKTIYQTDLQYALMKCIQELKEKNDALEARLAASDARIAALEAK